VAIATITAQGVSGILILRVLSKMRGPCRFKWQNLRFKWKNMREMLWIGVPAGFQASCFSLSNILIQSSINTFGSAVVAGITTSNTLDAISYIGHTAITQAVISFVGQNSGAGKIQRVKDSIRICTVMVTLWAVIVCLTMLTFGGQLMEIFSNDAEVIYYGVKKLHIVLPFIFICGIMEVQTGALRGLGKSVSPTVITLICVCLLRVVWIFAVFRPIRWNPDVSQETAFFVLFSCYPLTWLLNAAGIFLMLKNKIKKLCS
jgi:Na+-driven multidrug efflux pump